SMPVCAKNEKKPLDIASANGRSASQSPSRSAMEGAAGEVLRRIPFDNGEALPIVRREVLRREEARHRDRAGVDLLGVAVELGSALRPKPRSGHDYPSIWHAASV